IELSRDHAGQLREAAPEPVPRGALVPLDEGVPLERPEQPQRGRPVDVQLASHVRPGAPPTLGQQVEDGDRALDRTDPYLPLLAARAMQGALVILRPLIAETGAKPVGRYVIGTVKGDIHDIGKNLCVIMLEGAGFEVYDLGVNTPPEKFVEAVQKHEPDIVGFSAFLTTTKPMFKANIEALTKAGLRDKVHIAVGGAPVTQEYAKHVGADSYAP